jgi:hypothetical protein
MAVLEVNNVPIPDPSEITVSLQDVDYESGRDQTGTMFRDRKRGGNNAVRKIECKWNVLNSTDCKTLLMAVKDASMTLTFPDPYEGNNRTSTVYVGDRKAPIYWKDPATNKWVWKDVAFNFIEF